MFEHFMCKNLVLNTFLTNRAKLCEKCSSKYLMYSKLEAHMRDCEAWRSLKECVVFVDIMYTKRHGKQLWEKSWIVREN